MTPEQARLLAQGLLAAAAKAEAEGRTLIESDLSEFALMDDAARADLQSLIDKANA